MNGKTAKRIRKVVRQMSVGKEEALYLNNKGTKILDSNCSRFNYKMTKNIYKVFKKDGSKVKIKL